MLVVGLAHILHLHTVPYRCWTRNKYDKLRNFRLSSMWFASEKHSAELGELGRLEGEAGAEELKQLAAVLAEDHKLTYQQRWQIMSSVICAAPS
jgi:hypothetical protein